MTGERYLIVNADDFGQSSGVNRGVIEAHEHGIVTSASLMVRWPAADEAVQYARHQPNFSLGLHIDLGEWVWRDEKWEQRYQVVELSEIAAVREEVSRQVAAFRNLTGRDPTHIDSHQHVHLREPARSIVLCVAHELKVPLRSCSPEVLYCGSFYGQTEKGTPYPGGITVGALIKILAQLPLGVTELGCHPGKDQDLDTTYGRERREELETLCDPQVRSALSDLEIELRSFDAARDRSAAFDMEPTHT